MATFHGSCVSLIGLIDELSFNCLVGYFFGVELLDDLMTVIKLTTQTDDQTIMMMTMMMMFEVFV